MTTALTDAARLASVSPASGELLEAFDPMRPDQLDAALDAAVTAQAQWRRLPAEERGAPMRALADVLRVRSADLSELLTREMGKPITEAEAEVEKCAATAEWIAEHGLAMLAPQALDPTSASNVARFQPLGCVLAIMPWNYPLWQVMRAALPALMAGNAVVLKHAPNVTRCALTAEELFADAGFTKGLFTTLLIDTDTTARVITDRRISGVTLTGSVRAGEAVGRIAGGALKKVVLELGGSDPFIVLDDVNVDDVVAAAVRARFQNNGQSCIAAKRFIVHAGIAETFTERFVAAVAALRVGDPLDRETQIGPMARADLRDGLQSQLDRAVTQGAVAATGKGAISGAGWFFEPTVLADVAPENAAFTEETFGPLAAVTLATGDEQAIALANDSDYGLGSSIWTADERRAEAIADQLDAGMVFVNGIVASDARLPFGGVKRSGLGRELSIFGIREFTNIQLVSIQHRAGSASRGRG